MFNRILATGLLLTLGFMAAYGQETQSYKDPKGRFEIMLPSGWSITHQDSSTGYAQFSHRSGGGLALYFHESKPGKWTVQNLMPVLETGLRETFPVGELRVSHDLTTGGYPGRIMFFHSPELGGELVVSCVVFEEGGVTLQGIVSSPAPEQALIELLQNVRRSSGDQ